MSFLNPTPGTVPGTRRRRRGAPFGRSLVMAAALVAGLFPMASPVAAATAVVATGGSAISADTAAAGGTGAWTTLTGPTIVEAAAGQVGTGTIVLTLPGGFELDPASGAVALTGPSCAGLALSPLDLTATTATTTVSGRSTGACTLTWSGLAVRPTAGTPRANGVLVRGGTAAITGVASGASLGTISEVPGAPATLGFGSSPTGGTGGIAFGTQPAVAVRDQFGNPVTSATPTSGDVFGGRAIGRAKHDAGTGNGALLARRGAHERLEEVTVHVRDQQRKIERMGHGPLRTDHRAYRLDISGRRHPGCCLAERVGFEPTRLSPNGFQDRRLQPLGHLSRSAQDSSGRGHSTLTVHGMLGRPCVTDPFPECSPPCWLPSCWCRPWAARD